MLSTEHEISVFIRDFEGCTLPKTQWTHHAHLAVAFWYLTRHPYDDALNEVRQRIRAYNEAVGTPNTDNGGYHETLTRLFLQGVRKHLALRRGDALPVALDKLLQSPLGDKEWPLRFYSRERLFSVEARRHWIEPECSSDEINTGD